PSRKVNDLDVLQEGRDSTRRNFEGKEGLAQRPGVCDFRKTPLGGHGGLAAEGNYRLTATQLCIEFLLPMPARRNTLCRIEVQKHGMVPLLSQPPLDLGGHVVIFAT